MDYTDEQREEISLRSAYNFNQRLINCRYYSGEKWGSAKLYIIFDISGAKFKFFLEIIFCFNFSFLKCFMYEFLI